MEITLKFLSNIDLVEFDAAISHHDGKINNTHLTIAGVFDEPEIELAIRAFHAEIIPNDSLRYNG
jgi:hypothetical protein